jgi:hypothetical protein
VSFVPLISFIFNTTCCFSILPPIFFVLFHFILQQRMFCKFALNILLARSMLCVCVQKERNFHPLKSIQATNEPIQFSSFRAMPHIVYDIPWVNYWMQYSALLLYCVSMYSSLISLLTIRGFFLKVVYAEWKYKFLYIFLLLLLLSLSS